MGVKVWEQWQEPRKGNSEVTEELQKGNVHVVTLFAHFAFQGSYTVLMKKTTDFTRQHFRVCSFSRLKS